MISKSERFWITFVLRFAFGMFFLIAAINIFSAGGPHDFGPDWFAKTLSKGFKNTWAGDLLPEVDIPVREIGDAEAETASVGKPAEAAQAAPAAAVAAAPVKTEKVHPTYFFLFALPFLFAALSVPILTGIFLRPALRTGALLLVLLGLGKYIVASYETPADALSTTAHDFFFAFLICVGLYFLSQEKREEIESLV